MKNLDSEMNAKLNSVLGFSYKILFLLSATYLASKNGKGGHCQHKRKVYKSQYEYKNAELDYYFESVDKKCKERKRNQLKSHFIKATTVRRCSFLITVPTHGSLPNKFSIEICFL